MLHSYGTDVDNNIKELNRLVGKTLSEINESFQYVGDKYNQLLAKNTKIQKGIVGDFIEEIICCKVKDNLPELDSALGDVKTISVNSSGAARENLRITAINFQKMVSTPYQDSSLAYKTKENLIVVKIEPNKVDSTQSVFRGVYKINLAENDVQKKLVDDYNNVREFVLKGKACELTSKKDQANTVVKTYSHGTGTNLKKYTIENREYTAKGKAFYLFKNEINTMIKEYA